MSAAASPAYSDGLRAGEELIEFPCDRFLPQAAARYYRATDVDAPPAVLFRWLCQLRVAPYSYDWIDNFGRRSPRRLRPGLERLERGQRFMTIFTLVDFETDLQITLLCGARRIFGEVAGTYMIRPRDAGASRLLVKLAVSHPGGPIESRLRARLLPHADLVMMRKQLRTLRELAEREA
jgi:hypothetical protein